MLFRSDLKYGDIYLINEQEQSRYNFEIADTSKLYKMFEMCEDEARKLAGLKLVRPAYEQVLKCSHLFNLLDARNAVSVTERQEIIGRVRDIASRCARAYAESITPKAETTDGEEEKQ